MARSFWGPNWDATSADIERNNNSAVNSDFESAIDVMKNYSDEQTSAQVQANKDLMNYAFQLNSAAAKENRDFQELMSNTQYQRAVADLEKAGLNKLLAYSNLSGSVPAGSMASVSASSAGRGSDLTTLLNNIVSSANADKRIIGGVLDSLISGLFGIFRRK